ncbi:energy transducer TonB, partial [Dysgonomonas mossii]
SNLKYPVVAQESGIQGRVTVRFVVSKTGAIEDVNVIRGIDPSCDKEAVRVVKSMPKWIPGKQNGLNVPVYFTLPIVFRLKQ